MTGSLGDGDYLSCLRDPKSLLWQIYRFRGDSLVVEGRNLGGLVHPVVPRRGYHNSQSRTVDSSVEMASRYNRGRHTFGLLAKVSFGTTVRLCTNDSSCTEIQVR